MMNKKKIIKNKSPYTFPHPLANRLLIMSTLIKVHNILTDLGRMFNLLAIALIGSHYGSD